MAKDDITQATEEQTGRSVQDRAEERFTAAWAAYWQACGNGNSVPEPCETTISDMLVDMRHFAAAHEIEDWDDVEGSAAMHYHHESDDPDELLKDTV